MVGSLSQPFMGYALDRLGGRKVISISLVFLGVSTLLLRFTFSPYFPVFMFGFSVALGGAPNTNTAALLARWLRRRRATVMALESVGNGVQRGHPWGISYEPTLARCWTSSLSPVSHRSALTERLLHRTTFTSSRCWRKCIRLSLRTFLSRSARRYWPLYTPIGRNFTGWVHPRRDAGREQYPAGEKVGWVSAPLRAYTLA